MTVSAQGQGGYDEQGRIFGYSVCGVGFAPGKWQWSAYGPGGSESGQADNEQVAHALAANAMRRLRRYAGCDVVLDERVPPGQVKVIP